MQKSMIEKRSDYISWDEYFMGVALLSGKRSKDPSTQVGACIVNERNRIVGIGYNGFPSGCSDNALPWAREGDFMDTKYPYVVHAEVNAVLNSNQQDLTGCRVYVALFPCNECAKVLIQAGIKEVVYLSDKYSSSDSTVAARRMFEMAGIYLRELDADGLSVVIDFSLC